MLKLFHSLKFNPAQWKAVCRSVFLTIWHCNLRAELTKTTLLQNAFSAILSTGKCVRCSRWTNIIQPESVTCILRNDWIIDRYHAQRCLCLISILTFRTEDVSSRVE